MVELEFAQALESPFERFKQSFSFKLDIENDAFLPNVIDGEAKVMLEYYVDYDSVLHLEGNIRIPFKFVCDRCGSHFSQNLFLNYKDSVSPKIDDEEELSYDMPVVNIQDIISSYVILNFPTKVLCSEKCKGLCETCGANLNDGDCECQKNKVGKNNPFASLLNKFD